MFKNDVPNFVGAPASIGLGLLDAASFPPPPDTVTVFVTVSGGVPPATVTGMAIGSTALRVFWGSSWPSVAVAGSTVTAEVQVTTV